MQRWMMVLMAMALSAGVSLAQSERRTGSAPLQRADADGDGKVSWAEVQQAAPKYSQERFNKMDRNGDGFLSRDDMPKGKAKKGAAQGAMPQGEELVALLRRADADGNNEVTKEELKATAPRLARAGFAQLDKNEDGVVSEADFARRSDPSRPTPKAIRKADANGDGFWSYDEVKTVAENLQQRVFDSADKDGDGLLDQKELEGLRRTADRARNSRRPDYASARQDTLAKMLKSDVNEDGTLTYDELVAAKPGYPRENFDRADRNEDGVVSKEDAN